MMVDLCNICSAEVFMYMTACTDVRVVGVVHAGVLVATGVNRCDRPAQSSAMAIDGRATAADRYI